MCLHISLSIYIYREREKENACTHSVAADASVDMRQEYKRIEHRIATSERNRTIRQKRKHPDREVVGLA